MNRCGTVCGCRLHSGQVGSGSSPIRARYDLREIQCPERSCESVVLVGRGRALSDWLMAGGSVPRTTLGSADETAASTAEVWRALRVGGYVSGGVVPLTRYWEMDGRKRDWRVFLMVLGPEGWVTVVKLGWWGRRALERNCWQRRDKLAETGRTSTSLWRWETEAILWEPVAMRRAEFWIDWILAIADGEELGNQIGAA